MLRTAKHSINDDLDRLVENLLREDLDYERAENRSAHREHLVRPVLVALKGHADPIKGFSKNISNYGIGLITDSEIPLQTAAITIESLRGPANKVLAECRWCKPFGKNWFLSGWQFINVLQR